MKTLTIMFCCLLWIAGLIAVEWYQDGADAAAEYHDGQVLR